MREVVERRALFKGRRREFMASEAPVSVPESTHRVYVRRREVLRLYGVHWLVQQSSRVAEAPQDGPMQPM